MRFLKYEGAGNAYLVVPRIADPPGPEAVRRLCDRHRGLGSDGVLVETDGRGEADFGLRILNPDGSESGTSGNGLRIFARFLYDAGRVGDLPFSVRTPARRVICRVLEAGAEVEVRMGRATFASAEVPASGPAREIVDEPLEVGGERLLVTAVGMGNPHAVIPVERATSELAERLGPLVERHALFPERANVQFVEVVREGLVHVEVWERGAGRTLASGSSACAVAAALRRRGAHRADLEVRMPGGTLRITVSDDYDVTMRGPVARIAEGEVAEEALRPLPDEIEAGRV